MTFLDERISLKVARGVSGGPRVKRTKIYTQGGELVQLFEWDYSLARFDLKFGLKTAADFQQIRDFWYVVMLGAYEGFRMRDWSDYRALANNTALQLVSGTTWQLQRRYTAGATSVVRNIYKPSDDAAVVVYDAGNNVLTGSTDLATGRWTGSGTPAYWTGFFDVPVTFEDDDALVGVELDGHWQKILARMPSIYVEELLIRP